MSPFHHAAFMPSMASIYEDGTQTAREPTVPPHGHALPQQHHHHPGKYRSRSSQDAMSTPRVNESARYRSRSSQDVAQHQQTPRNRPAITPRKSILQHSASWSSFPSIPNTPHQGFYNDLTDEDLYDAADYDGAGRAPAALLASSRRQAAPSVSWPTSAAWRTLCLRGVALPSRQRKGIWVQLGLA
jgi:hypothetical protein